MTLISFFGLGRVGLVSAICFAKRGCQVTGIDPDIGKLELIRNSKPPFVEPGLDAYLREVVSSGTLTVTDDATQCEQSDIIYVTVGTPSSASGAIDLTQVKNAATMIGRALRDTKHNPVVATKSTVTPGTARRLVRPTLEKESHKSALTDFGIVSNPEFLREGSAVRDTEFPDRIVMGSDNPKAMDQLEAFYREYHGKDLPPIIRTTHENAELTKYANNAFLATKVSFINTIATIAEKIPSGDVSTIARGIGLDERIGPRFLNAGLGYGGSCFPKDVRAVIHLSKDLGCKPNLLEAASEVNRKQATKAVRFAKTALRSLRGKKVAILGLAFKPDTDDMREAVSIPIIRELTREGARVEAYDPAAIPVARQILSKQVKYAQNARECITGADLAILVTEWGEFKELSPRDFVSLMKTPIVFDGRRIYDFGQMRAAGIRFSAIGLGPEQR